MKEQNVNISVEDLNQLIATAVNSAVTTAVAEMRKPTPPDEKELEATRVAQEERRATAQSVIEKKQNERYIQEKVCTHFHAKREGGGTHCVYVRDNDVTQSPGYIYCQRCMGRIRPDEPIMRKLDPQAIFSTELFNKLLQDCIPNGAEMLG